MSEKVELNKNEFALGSSILRQKKTIHIPKHTEGSNIKRNKNKMERTHQLLFILPFATVM